MNDTKNMVMVIIIGITISLFLCFNTTVFATTGTVTSDNLRLRKESNASSSIVDLLDINQKVEILGEDGEWYKVKANDKVGYVKKEFIKLKEENVVINNEQNNTQTTTEQNDTKENKSEEQQKAEENNNQTVAPEVKEEPKIKNGKFATDTELRIMPLINGYVINTTKSDEQYEVINTVGLWSYVKSSSKTGWVLTEKITSLDSSNQVQENKTQEPKEEKKEEQKEEKKEEPKETKYSSVKTYYVKGTSVNVRSSADKNSDVIKTLNTNESVKVTGEIDSWYIVEINGKKAYISKSLLSSKKQETTSRSESSVSSAPQQTQQPATNVPSNPSGEAIVAYAKTFLGYRYVYGTNGPNTFDCSGFVQYVYKHFGYSLSRSSSTQAHDGVAVSKSNLQPGDVLIFRDTSNTRVGHVGIYIGGGQFIHASNSKTGVITSSLDSASYQKRYVGARRIL